MIGIRVLITASAALAALVLAPASVASEARYLFYFAERGEANDLILSKGPNAALGQTWTWSDPGAQVAANPPMCVSTGDHSAFCHPFEPTYYEFCHFSVIPSGGHSACPTGEVYLGDENDRARTDPDTGFAWSVDGGRGHDDIAGAATMRGGPGRDRLRGELVDFNGVDGQGVFLYGGRGNDRIEGSPGLDRIRCGSGSDTVIAEAPDRVAEDCERIIQAVHAYPPSPQL